MILANWKNQNELMSLISLSINFLTSLKSKLIFFGAERSNTEHFFAFKTDLKYSIGLNWKLIHADAKKFERIKKLSPIFLSLIISEEIKLKKKHFPVCLCVKIELKLFIWHIIKYGIPLSSNNFIKMTSVSLSSITCRLTYIQIYGHHSSF